MSYMWYVSAFILFVKSVFGFLFDFVAERGKMLINSVLIFCLILLNEHYI